MSRSPGLAWVDARRGMLRWHIHYNLLMLRLLSAFMDTHWVLCGQPHGKSLLGSTSSSSATRTKVCTHTRIARTHT
jgi:hypothetical protein